MENSIKEMVFVGHHHFSSKDKTQIYYVIQALYNEEDLTRGNNRGTMINIFVDEEQYKKITKMVIGEVLKVNLIPNISTGKLYYKVVL